MSPTKLIPSLVTHQILTSTYSSTQSIHYPDYACAASSFDMAFFPWGGQPGDLGGEWVIRADRWGPSDPEHKTLHYIGYSQEEECRQMKHVPHDQRAQSAWFYSKQATYAYSGWPEFGWNRSYFTLARESLSQFDLTFKGAYQIDETFLPDRIEDGPMEAIPGIDNLGRIGAEQFSNEIANTKILVGIGQPWLAPSAYLALCFGTPFLNVIKRWDVDNPDDKAKWDSQHNVLMALDPPYVYNVKAGDYEGFVHAIHSALITPTPPYIDPEMTDAGMRERMRTLIEGDWKSLAEIKYRENVERGSKPFWVV